MIEPFKFDQFKNTIGFDEMFKRLSAMTDSLPKISTYPPYNIKKVGDNKYVIEMAVAGFGKQDIEIEMKEDVLTVKGYIDVNGENDAYLFKGIADRAFTRSFALADTVEVKNADLVNGMLKIFLERFVPEEKQPKKVQINAA